MSCGQCVVTAETRDDDGNVTSVRVGHYDDPILISAELLDTMREAPPEWWAHFDGDTMTLRASNIHLTYAIAGYLPPDQRPDATTNFATLRGTLVSASKP